MPTDTTTGLENALTVVSAIKLSLSGYKGVLPVESVLAMLDDIIKEIQEGESGVKTVIQQVVQSNSAGMEYDPIQRKFIKTKL